MTLNEPQTPPQHKTDLKKGGWIDRFLPNCCQPYAYLMRLDRPIGTWLLLLPGLWSIALAQAVHPDWKQGLTLMILFTFGAIIMRGMGCAVNDLWDRDIDAQVERTKTRPLVAGTITVQQALILILILSILGLMTLLTLNRLTLILGFVALPLIILYPVMKRITWWPQAFLGLTFNFGTLMGWTAMTGKIDLTAILLYGAGIFWTLGYDTVYAHMDAKDDALIGVKSTARLFGPKKSKTMIAFFYTMTTLLIMVAFNQIIPITESIGAVMPIGFLFVKQILQFQAEDPAQCLKIFRSNRDQGLLIFIIALIIGQSV